jgi:membrane protease YdiL (CAAX protease family)
MSGKIVPGLLMNDPAERPTAPPEVVQPSEASGGGELVRASEPAPEKSLPEFIFLGAHGVRLGWRIALYLLLAVMIVEVFRWLGASIFPDPHGAARRWQELYTECYLALAAFAPAVLLARIEHRSVDDYGLPRREAFGRNFWVGVAWGFVSITALMALLYAAGVYTFGSFVFHGERMVRFALFWAAFFLVVGLFEEFLFRGYLVFAIGERTKFWPVAAISSLIFGAVHIGNSGETLAGGLGAALIGLFFCLTLRRTGSLWFAVGFHTSWDWGETFFYGVPNSGTTEPGHLLSPTIHGKSWLSGGTVGPEASVMLLVVLVVMWVVFHRQYRDARYLASRRGELAASGAPRTSFADDATLRSE